MSDTNRRSKVIAQAVAGLLGCSLSMAHAGVFGSLANFDVVNDTGYEAHGFEIELEGIDKSQVVDVFGLNRNFGTASPGDVERYGIPTVNNVVNGVGAVTGVRITYQAAFSAGAWSVGTASGTFSTPGESCWSFGNVGYPNVPCDHFGVSTYGNPTRTTYKWLVDPGNTGALTPVSTAIPSVTFTPPTPAAPAPVAVIQAVPDVKPKREDNAYWVKIVTTSMEENVDVNDLMGGRNAFAKDAIAALNDKRETEIEWQVLQPGMVDEVSKAVGMNAADKSVVIRYEFFRYLGKFDDDGFVDPIKEQFPTGNTLNEYVGDYLGEQIAGFNADQPLMAPVPEPETYAMMLAGLALIGRAARRRNA